MVHKISNEARKKAATFCALLIIIFVPLFTTLAFTAALKLENFSPNDPKSEALENHLEQHAWIFAILNLAPDIPYYSIEPNVDGLSPAMTTTYTLKDKRIEVSVPYDSLTCISDPAKAFSQEELLKLNWSDCKFMKKFAFGFSTGGGNPKINLKIGLVGFWTIYIASFLVINGFVSLSINLYKELQGILQSVFHVY